MGKKHKRIIKVLTITMQVYDLPLFMAIIINISACQKFLTAVQSRYIAKITTSRN